jgi:hypothetical protein
MPLGCHAGNENEMNRPISVLSCKNPLLVQLCFLNPRWRMASNTTTAAALDTFIESIIPCIGIMILADAFLTQRSDKPVASVPITMAAGWL